jgi:Tfp pilus assembly protein PilE
MVLVAVIVILATIAVPNFLSFQCRARISEARAVLKGAYVGNLSYFGEHELFTDQISDLGLDLTGAMGSTGTGKYYKFEITLPTPLTFEGNAKALNPRWGEFRLGYYGPQQLTNGMLTIVAPPCQ